MDRVQWLLVAAVIAIAVVAGAWFGGRAPEPPPLLIDRQTSAETQLGGSPAITVHVAGAVHRPGLVSVEASARVADAIAAAGGVLATADLTSINLAASLRDGQQVTVPVLGRASSAGPISDGIVRLNDASVEELRLLPGIGRVLAERIVAHRDRHGPFAQIEDLLDVPGIGEGRLGALRDAVAVP